MAELVQQVTSLNLEQELKDLEGSEIETSNEVLEDESDEEGEYVDEDYEELENDNRQSDRKSGSSIDKKAIAIFQQWLIQKSSCPVTYDWDDLGEYFWPRWIKKGHCSGEIANTNTEALAKVGCSWPLGMRCVPGQTETLHILRWHCRRRRRKNRRAGAKKQSKLQCKWYKVPYPVTSSCKCACQ
jgi:hypothetical protein